MTREFKMPPDAFSARTERGSAKGIMRVEAASHPEGATARLPMFLNTPVDGKMQAVFSDDAIDLIRKLIREELAAANSDRPQPKVTVSFTDDLVAKIAHQAALRVAHIPSQPRRR